MYSDPLGFTYVGPLILGTRQTTLDVVYDTGSDWLAVEGSTCSSCEGNTFNGRDSGVRTGAEEEERNYGSVSLTGYTYSDVVCVTPQHCVNGFEYFLIESQVGVDGYAGLVEPVDGILGMARDIVPEGLDYDVGPLYVKALREMYHTQYDVFSFYLDDPSDTSFIDFNGFVSSHIKDGDADRIAWLKMEDDFYWSSFC